MKNFRIVLLAAVALMASACFSHKPSTANYTLVGNFEYAYGYLGFKDSVYHAQNILTDEISCLFSSYEDQSFKGGWSLSVKIDSLDADGNVSPYSSAGPGAGAGKSDVYAVFYQNPDNGVMTDYDWKIFFDGYSEHNCTLIGCYIDNSSTTLKTLEANPLVDGDYMKLVVTGYLEDAEKGSVETYLFQCTDGKSEVVTKWTSLDLSSIGNVDALRFRLVSNRSDVEPYFCMDSITMRVSLVY